LEFLHRYDDSVIKAIIRVFRASFGPLVNDSDTMLCDMIAKEFTDVLWGQTLKVPITAHTPSRPIIPFTIAGNATDDGPVDKVCFIHVHHPASSVMLLAKTTYVKFMEE